MSVAEEMAVKATQTRSTDAPISIHIFKMAACCSCADSAGGHEMVDKIGACKALAGSKGTGYLGTEFCLI